MNTEPDYSDKPKIKLDWSKLPKEAMWVAMDENRMMCVYQSKPTLRNRTWFSPDVEWQSVKDFAFSGDWKDSLTPRPEEKCDHLREAGEHCYACEDDALQPQPRKEGDAEMKLVPLNCPHGWHKRNEMPCPKCLEQFKDAARKSSSPPTTGEPIKGDPITLAQSFEIGYATAQKDIEKLQSEQNRLRMALCDICEEQKVLGLFDKIDQAKQLLEEIKP